MSREVAYSFEHGDPSLPPLRELVSSTPDPEKEKILRYLRLRFHHQLACPGIVQDEIDPENVIGGGDLYSDHVYDWQDVFINYVDQYNIPVPEPFRSHVLSNYDACMACFEAYCRVDNAEILCQPKPGQDYRVRIYKNGAIRYQDEPLFSIKPDDAHYMIDPILKNLFYFTSEEDHTDIPEAARWQLTFFQNNEPVKRVGGTSVGDRFSYCELTSMLKFMERYIPRDLGARHLPPYQGKEDKKMATTYHIERINAKERWVFIGSSDPFDTEEPDAFVHLMNRIRDGVKGHIVHTGEMTFAIPEDGLGLRYQWDDLFGITVVWPPEVSREAVISFLNVFFEGKELP